MTGENCLICGTAAHTQPGYQGVHQCALCGRYNLGDYVSGVLSDNFNPGKYDIAKLKATLFYYLRVIKNNHHKFDEQIVNITMESTGNENNIGLKEVYHLYPNNFSQRVDKIMELLHSNISNVGHRLNDSTLAGVGKEGLNAFFMPVTMEKRECQREEFINLLYEMGYITGTHNNDIIDITFTSKGWEKIDSLQRKNKSETAFIAMSFSFTDPIIASAKKNALNKQ